MYNCDKEIKLFDILELHISMRFGLTKHVLDPIVTTRSDRLKSVQHGTISKLAIHLVLQLTDNAYLPEKLREL